MIGESVIRGAVISPESRYRYALYRRWRAGDGRLLWVMLNPSTADAEQDDPTIRRCIDFSKRWGYDSLAVVNLFALRSTKPEGILHAGFPVAVGPDNDDWIVDEARRATCVMAAWGARSFGRFGLFGRDRAVRALLASHHVFHLGLTLNGNHPRHPLYVSASATPTRWGAL